MSKTARVEKGQKVKVEVDFNRVDLYDHQEEGVLSGFIYFMIYKGNHYHITVLTDEGHHIWVDTDDVWDKGDQVGIDFPAKHIKITPLSDE